MEILLISGMGKRELINLSSMNYIISINPGNGDLRITKFDIEFDTRFSWGEFSYYLDWNMEG